MPRHDFFCSACAAVLTNVDIPIAIGARKGAPACPRCAGPTQWIPAVGRMDVHSDGGTGESFQKFTTRDGRNQLVEIDSLHKLRQVERESETLARNGEGQQVNFRLWSNDNGNRQTHSLQPDFKQAAPTPEAKRKFGSARRALTEAQAETVGTYGPGVTDANTSAL